MKKLFATIGLFIFCLSNSAWSQKPAKQKTPHAHHEAEKNDEKEEHAHDKKEEPEHAEGKDEHGHGEGKDEHGHTNEEGGHGEEEAAANVGPDKGILEANDKDGFKLSPEALKNFEIQTINLSGSGPWTVPMSARLLAGEETNLYRFREDYYKRIDFKTIKKMNGQLMVSSAELKPGDKLVTNGIGFLRIAELAAFGGAPEGHSH